ncbi:MAG: hypothetical protein J6J83_07185 [Oscillospiraceae bacterium]|nr:hypothetical protein [Oscillospiraceae bacterium]
MFFPKLNILRQSRVTVSRFLGYDRRERAAQGSFSHMENLCSDAYPALQVRCKRGTVGQAERPNALTEKEALIWVDGSTLYVNGLATGLVLTDSPKQLISMGAYLVIFPDKKWINTRDLSRFGSLENRTESHGTVTFSLCRADGTAFERYLTAQQQPQQPEAGALWLDTSGDAPVLRRYEESGWAAVEETCVKIAAAGIGIGFAAGDGVTISGCESAGLDGSAVLLQAQDDALVVTGILWGDTTQDTAVTVARTVPEMDFVTQCGNRLWGCKYGVVDGRAVNEIYASKLGDFKNWNCFAGLSTDSYAASRGSDGAFTAAAAYLGSVLFFKEECIERVYTNAAGAHQIVTLECAGVKKGSHNSVQTVEGTLYYHGSGGVYAFDGSLPVSVSQALGDLSLRDAAAGAVDGRYYLSAQSDDGAQLLVYDTRLGLWHREDSLRVTDFAARGEELYALTDHGEILSLRGGEEERIAWLAESGELGIDTAQQKYLIRVSVQLQLAQDAAVEAYISYDGGKSWQAQGVLQGTGAMGRSCLHLRPRRCDRLRWRLQGVGDCTVYSVSAVYEKGSDSL